MKTTRKVILIIEDNNSILENLTEYLENEGFKIIAVNNRSRGVELAKKKFPDLILCDVLMPDMYGYNVLRVLLATAKAYEIPFIFSTSNSKEGDREEALKLGADDYIIRPFEPETLLRMANAWINQVA